MRHLPCLGFAIFAACAGAPPAVRSTAVPLGPPARAADLTKDQGQRAGADRSPPVRSADAPGQGDVVVSVRNLPQWEPPVSPPPKEPPAPEQRVTEQPAAPAWSSGGEVDPGQGQYQTYGQAYWQQQYAPERREPWFPVGTLVGIGIGSAIDHHHSYHHGHHHHGNGAWIGGSIGLMFDLQRLWH